MATAGRIVKMLEPLDPFFLEEPVPPENMEAMATLQASTNIPIATGEGIQGHFHFAPLLEKRAARILQPDVARTGGITAMKKIAAIADAHYVTFAPPSNGPVCTAASLHVAASPNFLIMEGQHADRRVQRHLHGGCHAANGGLPALASGSISPRLQNTAYP
jgi:galactonate dehydratase